LRVILATCSMPALGGKGTNNMPTHHTLVDFRRTLLIGLFLTTVGTMAPAKAQYSAPTQPWGLPPVPSGIGSVEKFADIGNTPQGQFLEGGAFDTQGNLWFVAIGSGWVS
jgi:hypothetical protein